MRVLHLGKFYPIAGGVEKVMFGLATGVSKRGIECDVLCTYSGGDEYVESMRLGDNSIAYFDKSLAKICATTISPGLIGHLKKICSGYDIIHVHHPDPMAALALYFSGFKGKVLLHWHSDVVKHKHILKCYQPLQNWLIKRSNVIVGTTPIYVEQSPYLSEAQDKTSFLPIGVEEKTVDQASVDAIQLQYPGKKIILSIGRLVPYKGFEYLIDAAQYLDDQYVILIGGDGPLRQTLQTKIDTETLSNKVKLLGFIPSDIKFAYYRASTLFCLSSIMKSEAFAIVQVEAMSCHKPVVATNIPGSGVPWVNKHGYSGLNVAPRDGRAIAEAIVDICDEKHYANYCSQARQRFIDLFTMPKMIDNCLSIYQNLLHEY